MLSRICTIEVETTKPSGYLMRPSALSIRVLARPCGHPRRSPDQSPTRESALCLLHGIRVLNMVSMPEACQSSTDGKVFGHLERRDEDDPLGALSGCQDNQEGRPKHEVGPSALGAWPGDKVAAGAGARKWQRIAKLLLSAHQSTAPPARR